MPSSEPGKILVGEIDNGYLIKLRGYVRLTLCASLGRYLERIFSNPRHPDQVLIDLNDATGLDSTTLGLIARLALFCEDEFHFKPLVFCHRAELLRELQAMALEDHLDLESREPGKTPPLSELPPVNAPQSELKTRIIDAHRLLATINPEREQEFLDLIRTIEQENCP